MKVKNLAIMVLMIIILIIASIKVEATQDGDIAEPVTKTINTTGEPAENEQYVLEQETEVRPVPLIYSKVNGKITGNVKVVEIINDWCKVENDEETGWIRKSLLNKTVNQDEETTVQDEEQPIEESSSESQEEDTENDNTDNSEETTTPTSESVESINKTGYVNAEGLVVRKKPSTDSEELDSLSKNDKLEITGQVDGWYQIKLNGETGYVSSKYVSDKKVTETTSRSGSSITAKKVTPMNVDTESEDTDTSSSVTTGTAVVEYAKNYLGYKYVSGGSTPSTGFDCSGFTCYVFSNFGMTLNRSSKDQIKNGIAIERTNLQPGDLIIFNNSSNTAIGHVGIYVGSNNFIHAANAGQGVVITSLSSSYYDKRYVGARRVI